MLQGEFLDGQRNVLQVRQPRLVCHLAHPLAEGLAEFALLLPTGRSSVAIGVEKLDLSRENSSASSSFPEAPI